MKEQSENSQTMKKPVVLISRCIEFEACRYNGQKINSAEANALAPFVKFLPVCPECEIGLPVPRNALRLISSDDGYKLVDSAEGRDYTQDMQQFSSKFVNSHREINGAILKNRSPSCGIGDVKVYHMHGKTAAAHSKGVGLFGQAVLDTFPGIPVEDEGRLNNLRLREHFFTRLFILYDFTNLPLAMGALVDFHSRNKYLFMSYSQSLLQQAGRITANHEKLTTSEVFSRYKAVLNRMFDALPRIQTNINVLQHIFGYVSSHISTGERRLFLDTLERYRRLQVPLAAVTSILRSWIIRFDSSYLAQQTYFQPFPEDLQRIFDSNKGRI